MLNYQLIDRVESANPIMPAVAPADNMMNLEDRFGSLCYPDLVISGITARTPDPRELAKKEGGEVDVD